MTLKVVLAAIAVIMGLGGAHANAHLKREAYSGEWESLACEINPPYNTTTGISTGGYFKRQFILNKNGSWSGLFIGYSDAACENQLWTYPTPEGITFTVGGAAKNVKPAEEAEFGTGGDNKEYDIAYLVTDDLLFLGARPVQGGGLTAGEFMRPVSLAPLLKRKGSNPAIPKPTLKSMTGEWVSGCEKNTPIEQSTGESAGYFTREFRIEGTGKWWGTFTRYTDDKCTNMAESLESYPNPFKIEAQSIELKDEVPDMAFTVFADFDTGMGFKEHDIAMVINDNLFLGARHRDGSMMHKRAISYAPPLTRKDNKDDGPVSSATTFASLSAILLGAAALLQAVFVF